MKSEVFSLCLRQEKNENSKQKNCVYLAKWVQMQMEEQSKKHWINYDRKNATNIPSSGKMKMQIATESSTKKKSILVLVVMRPIAFIRVEQTNIMHF